uniref:Uncharacterized protein n=1 Tax=Plectus sambesii TaxID=2011161 RepID=A0A914WVU8_9BILA
MPIESVGRAIRSTTTRTAMISDQTVGLAYGEQRRRRRWALGRRVSTRVSDAGRAGGGGDWNRNRVGLVQLSRRPSEPVEHESRPGPFSLRAPMTALTTADGRRRPLRQVKRFARRATVNEVLRRPASSSADCLINYATVRARPSPPMTSRRALLDVSAKFIAALLACCIPTVEGIKCYSCASEDYRELWQRYDEIRETKNRPAVFDRTCDLANRLRLIAPLSECPTTCVTVFEPKFIGGLVTDVHPFTFLRGCADDIFKIRGRPRATNRPREIDYLLKEDICLTVPVSEIWPTVYQAGHGYEDVQVCSCRSDACNTQETVKNSAGAVNYSLQLVTPLLVAILWPIR